MKWLLGIAISFMAGFALSQPPWTAKILQHWVGNHDGPVELVARNRSTGGYAMTEIRAVSNKGCAADLGVTGSNYNDPEGGLGSSEAFLVSESGCAGMHLKTNNGAIKITTNHPRYTTTIDRGRVVLPTQFEGDFCGPRMPAPKSGAVLCVDIAGTAYIATKKGVFALNTAATLR